MNEDEASRANIKASLARVSTGSWWKPQPRTIIITLSAIVSVGLLALLVFAGRDNSGDAAGQGLAGAFEAAFFAFGVFAIALVALVIWLIRYVRWPTIVMIVLGIITLTFIALTR